MSEINNAFTKMIEFDKGDTNRIQHFTKVYTYAHFIGIGEKLNDVTQRTLELAAIVHDIGIIPAEKKYGYQNGKLQEEIGPLYAKKLLEEIGVEESISKRVEFLVAHHHTYKDVDGIDWQILIEADFLVNSCEKNLPVETIRNTVEEIFKTETGIRFVKLMYGLEE